MYDIRIYEDENGKSKIKDYINNLNKKGDKDNRIKLNKIIAYIRKLSEKGLSIGEPYVKHLQEEIWELRPIKDRILFAYIENNRFILLSIFTKQTNKTPKKEIEKAKNILKRYKKWSDIDE